MNRMQSLFVYKGKKQKAMIGFIIWIIGVILTIRAATEIWHRLGRVLLLGQGKLAANAEIGLRHPPCMGEILSHEQGNQPLRFKKSVGLSPNCSL